MYDCFTEGFDTADLKQAAPLLSELTRANNPEATMDVPGWLKNLGLEQYEAVFRENDIDGSVLSSLTNEDLKDIGVASVGHRRKLLDAIAKLRDVSSAATVAGPNLGTSAEAERRQLTLMFCDLVGSTALSARLDPEDLRAILGLYHAAVAEEVRRLGGYVAKYMGDGVLVYFGYPRALEHDAERAMRAGLALVARIGGLDAAAGRLAVRIGIATGLVVVGDLIGSGEAQERGVVGETPNLAARLQAMAQPNTVLIDETTRRLVGDLFEYRDLGAVEVRGIAEPVPVFEVLRPSAVESRFEALRAATLSPLVGRDGEIELLLRRWARAKAGDGQVVLISGEPGIGKSRLAAALQQRLGDEAHTRLRYFCSPHYQDSPLYPFIAQLERAAGFAREDPPAAKLDKLEALLAQAGKVDGEAAGLFADLLGLPAEGRYPPLPQDSQRRREMMLSALLAQFEALAQWRPVLMIFEDGHWADSTSLELLDRTVDRAARLPALLVITFRPEFAAPWLGQPHVSALSLNRLAQRDTAALVRGITAGKRLPPEILDHIVERTDGIPLFIEELTKSLLEGGLLREEADGYVLAGPLPPLAIPSSLHASLLARLDRLAPARQVAQIGAAIGREFSHELLAAVTLRSEARLTDALDQLIVAGLVFCRGTPPRSSYTFKHALIQDAAYSTLLRSQRQELHARIGHALQQSFPETAESQPEILARHFEHAGMIAEAVDFWIRAGDIARYRSANTEAVAHFSRSLELIPALGDPRLRAAEELKVQYALGRVHQATKGYASPEAALAYQRMSELYEQVGDTEQLMHVLTALRTLNQVQGRSLAARHCISQCLDIARQSSDRIFLVQANVGLGHTLCIMGCFAEARSHLAEGIAGYDSSDHATHQAISGYDPRVFGLGIVGWNDWFLGYPDQALGAALEGIAEAQRIGYPQGVEQALNSAAHACLLRREPDAALLHIDAGFRIAREQGFQYRIAMLRIWHGWASLLLGDSRGAVRELSEGLAACRATGAHAWQTLYLAILADGYGCSGAISQGLTTIAEARRAAQSQDECWWSAELDRLEGDLLLLSDGSQDRVEQCYRRALETARRQQAKSWELRAALSLARLCRVQGRRAEARDRLAPVYGWFTEGFGTPDLKEAKALIDELM